MKSKTNSKSSKKFTPSLSAADTDEELNPSSDLSVSSSSSFRLLARYPLLTDTSLPPWLAAEAEDLGLDHQHLELQQREVEDAIINLQQIKQQQQQQQIDLTTTTAAVEGDSGSGDTMDSISSTIVPRTTRSMRNRLLGLDGSVNPTELLTPRPPRVRRRQAPRSNQGNLILQSGWEEDACVCSLCGSECDDFEQLQIHILLNCDGGQGETMQ